MIKGFCRPVVLMAAVLLFAINGYAQSTELTFQGQLQSAGSAANGTFDLEFSVFDSPGGGSLIGSTLSRSGVVVVNGIFSVNLDFGAGFPGADRYLEIRVRSGGGGFTTLSPRQRITSTPYSIKSLTADTADTANSAVNATNATNATTAVTATNFTGPLAGDVTGNQAATTVARLRGRTVASTAPTSGQVLKYNGAEWEPGTDNTGSGGGGGTITGVTAGTGLTGGGTTGSVTLAIANGGVGTAQIADASVTDAKIVGISGAKVTGAVTNSNQLGGLAASSYLQTTGNGSGLTNLNASNITTGTLANARLGQIPTANIADNAVTAPKIAGGQVVKGVTVGATTLTDNVTLAAGSYITLTPAGNTVTIAASGGGGCPSPCTAAIFNATQQYNIGGSRLLSVAGSSTIVGLDAGDLNTGSDNSFFGYFAGFENKAGSRNSFFGAGTGAVNNVNDNSFFGYSSGFQNTGSENSFFGSEAGLESGGSLNSFFGFRAGRGNVGGGFNSFFGHSAGLANNAGSQNSFFGQQAGQSNMIGNNNSFFGVIAGTANTSGFNNTALGRNSNFSAGGLNNATAIGANALVGQNHSMVLGSIAGVNGASTSVSVGIGTTTPQSRFHVVGSSWFQGDNTPLPAAAGKGIIVGFGGEQGYIQAFDYGTFTPKNLLINNSGGNVGIGTPAPLSRLDIAAGGDGVELLRLSTERPWLFRQVRTGPSAGIQFYSTSGQKAFEITTVEGSNVATFFADGNASKVGIATTAPTATLDVNGVMRVRLLLAGPPVADVCADANFVLVNCASSSLLLKTNVHTYSDGLNVLRQLRPISYNWKDGGADDIGLGAEDVAKVAPFFAFRNKEGAVEGVKYQRLNILLINAVNQQQEQIETLTTKNRSLKQQHALIEARLSTMETMLRRFSAKAGKSSGRKARSSK